MRRLVVVDENAKLPLALSVSSTALDLLPLPPILAHLSLEEEVRTLAHAATLKRWRARIWRAVAFFGDRDSRSGRDE